MTTAVAAMNDPVVVVGIVLAVAMVLLWRRTSRLQRRVSDFSVRLAKYEAEIQSHSTALAYLRQRVDT